MGKGKFRAHKQLAQCHCSGDINLIKVYSLEKKNLRTSPWDLPGDTEVKTSPSKAGGVGLILD